MEDKRKTGAADEPRCADGTATRSSSLTWMGLAVIAGLFCLYLLVSTFSRYTGLGQTGSNHPMVGTELFHLALESLTGDGGSIGLDDLSGKVALINFWGPWCPPCVEELPHVAELESKHRGESDFQLLAVSCEGGSQESLSELRGSTAALLEIADIDMPTYHDPGGTSRKALGIMTGMDWFIYPTTVLIDRRGVIRGLWLGYVPGNEKQMELEVERLLVGHDMATR